MVKIVVRLFTEHPRSVGESYTEHMGNAFSFGSEMVINGVACLIHGVLPFLFKTTGSNAVRRLHHRMVVHRDKRKAPAALVTPAE